MSLEFRDDLNDDIEGPDKRTGNINITIPGQRDPCGYLCKVNGTWVFAIRPNQMILIGTSRLLREIADKLDELNKTT